VAAASHALVLFLGLTCATAFRAYLTRMLRHLDPSTTIPNRVRTAFDTLAEGLMVVDPGGRLVLANRALAEVTGLEAEVAHRPQRRRAALGARRAGPSGGYPRTCGKRLDRRPGCQSATTSPSCPGWWRSRTGRFIRAT
jgi:PAS domain-containing protein